MAKTTEKLRAIIVIRNDDDREEARKVFEEREFTVTLAKNKDQALKFMKVNSAFQVALIDAHLPNGGSTIVATKVRQGSGSNVKVIWLRVPGVVGVAERGRDTFLDPDQMAGSLARQLERFGYNI